MSNLRCLSFTVFLFLSIEMKHVSSDVILSLSLDEQGNLFFFRRECRRYFCANISFGVDICKWIVKARRNEFVFIWLRKIHQDSPFETTRHKRKKKKKRNCLARLSMGSLVLWHLQQKKIRKKIFLTLRARERIREMLDRWENDT